MSTYLLVRRFQSPQWLIFNGAGSRTIRNHGYSGAATLARHEMANMGGKRMNEGCSPTRCDDGEELFQADIYLPVASVLMGREFKKLRTCQDVRLPPPLKTSMRR